MSNTTYTDQILMSLNRDKSVRSIQFYDHLEVTDDADNVLGTYPQPPRDVQASDANALLSAAAIAQQATITTQAAQLTRAAADLATAQAAAEAAQDQVTQIQAQFATTTTPPASDSDALLGKLNGVFATIPAENQPQFANEYATVRVLIQAGQPALAAAVIESVAVPDVLAPLKAQILAALQS